VAPKKQRIIRAFFGGPFLALLNQLKIAWQT
jgi:hypothetical protein